MRHPNSIAAYLAVEVGVQIRMAVTDQFPDGKVKGMGSIAY